MTKDIIDDLVLDNVDRLILDNIDDLILETEPKSRIYELPSDIEKINSDCIKCLICNNESGTLRIIQHCYNCKYYFNYYIDNPICMNTIDKSFNKLDPSISIGILQHEYGIINKRSEKKIIGTFGAGPCIILCMHNRETTETILAHIDCMTLNPFQIFYDFPQEKCDVYIIGGDNSSIDKVNEILKIIKRKNYNLKFAHIIDNKSNSFAINCVTNEIYLNSEIKPIRDLPLVYNIKQRKNDLSMLMFDFEKTPLNCILIPQEAH
jgi:hypothetical protein